MRLKIQSFIGSLVQFDMSDGLPLTQRVLIAYERHVKDQLKCILSIPEESKMDFVASLNELLKAIWSSTKGTMLCYTALPEHSVTLFMCEVARFVAKENHSDTEFKSPLSYLMPDMKELESNSESCANLDQLALEELVKSHVLSQDGKYLLPASSLLSEQYTSVDPKPDPVPNPYWDTTDYDSASAAYISETDLKKLERHSNLTMAVAETKRALCQMMNEKSNLLGQLRELVRLLTLNDVNHQGSEVNAGGGAYPAILRFKYYYDSLTQRDKKSIPANLKHEIELLLCLAFNKEENRDAVATIETCIATRRKKLVTAMRGSYEILSQIDSSDQKRATCIKNAKAEYDNALKSLKLALGKGGHYAGQDQLSITTKLLRDLNIRFSVESQSDLMQLKLLSSDILNELLSENEELRSQIVTQLGGYKGLIDFSRELSCENLRVLLSQRGNSFREELIPSPRHLHLWLQSLSLDKLTVVCQVLGNNLSEIIKTAEDFKAVILFAEPMPCLHVCKALQDNLPNIIQTAADFELVCDSLRSDKRAIVYDVMHENIPKMIKTTVDFASILRHLTVVQRADVYGAVKGDLSEIMKTIDSAQHLINLFDFLTTEQRVTVYSSISEKIPGLIDTAANFKSIFKYLNSEQRVTVYGTISEKIPDLINSAMDFEYIIEHLTSEQRDTLCKTIYKKIPELINYAMDFSSVVNHLSPEQALFVCKVLLRRTDKEKRNHPFLYSNIEKKLSDVYQQLGDELPCYIENGKDFRLALKRSDSKVKKVFINSMIGMLKSDELSLVARAIEVGHLFSDSLRKKIDSLAAVVDSLEVEEKENSLQKFFDIMTLKPRGCLVRTWEIYRKYKGSIHANNVSLLKDLHAVNFERASFLSRTAVFGRGSNSGDDSSFLEPPQGTRRHKIRQVLNSNQLDGRLLSQNENKTNGVGCSRIFCASESNRRSSEPQAITQNTFNLARSPEP